jgi:hypothetical protein
LLLHFISSSDICRTYVHKAKNGFPQTTRSNVPFIFGKRFSANCKNLFSSELSLPENLSDYDLRSLQAFIVSPSGVEEPCFLKKLPKGNNGISFTPREIGEHQVFIFIFCQSSNNNAY